MITSPRNPKIKEIRLLKQTKYREARGEYLIEGVRLLEEALHQKIPLSHLVYSPRLERNLRGRELLSLARRGVPEEKTYYVGDEIVALLSETQTHQGVVGVLKKQEYRLEEMTQRGGMILLLFALQDPGNLGTVFRVADAGGAAGIILSQGSVDPYNPKVLRASMGSLFRLPFLKQEDISSLLVKLRSRGYRIYATDVRDRPSFWETDLTGPVAVLFGQEGAGLPPLLMEKADGLFTIPMKPQVDSLNVAMSVGLVVYEALRQKTVLSFGC